MIYEKQLKIGKVERYTLGIGAWLNGESIASATVTASAGVTVGAVDFSGETVGVLLTGVSLGRVSLVFNYTTATRSDSDKHQVEAMIKQQRYSASFIASTLGMCENTVRVAQKRLGLTYSEAVKKRNEKVKIAHRLRLDGMTAVDACKQAGITVSMYNRVKYEIGLVKKGA